MRTRWEYLAKGLERTSPKIVSIGKHGKATAADSAIAVADNGGHALSGLGGIAIALDEGMASVGNYGVAIAGEEGFAVAGVCGLAKTGDFGDAVAGDAGTAWAQAYGTARAGFGGRILLEWYDEDALRYRITVGYIGENGLKPNTAYAQGERGTFVEANPHKDVT